MFMLTVLRERQRTVWNVRSKNQFGSEHGVHVVYKRESLTPEADFCGLDNVVSEESLFEDESAIFEDVFVTGQKLVEQSDLIVSNIWENI